jgi:hypothetical protein
MCDISRKPNHHPERKHNSLRFGDISNTSAKIIRTDKQMQKKVLQMHYFTGSNRIFFVNDGLKLFLHSIYKHQGCGENPRCTETPS